VHARYLTVALRAEPAANRARPSGMNTTPRVRFRGPLRTTALWSAALMSGVTLLLAGCSASPSSSPSASSGAVQSGPGAAVPAREPAAGAASSPGAAAPSASATKASQLALATQSIVYTASITIRAKNVTTAAARATSIVTGEGGYVSSEQASVNPRDPARSTVSLQLKIPVPVYAGTLSTLSTVLGTQTSLTQHAQDVTEEVADVTSLVTSAQAAITQLQALLQRAGSISQLLTVQQQISTQESSLEALQAQQRALSRETSYATVSVTLRGPPQRAVKKKARTRRRQHGFVAGFTAGWHGLRTVVSGLLTGLGAVLPFAVVIAVIAAAGYAARRRLMRLLRRRSRPTPAG
jgi:Domain of unknown function (DUF4349)